jgi:hypothetical protein
MEHPFSHILSERSKRQCRNVFIWCSNKITIGRESEFLHCQITTYYILGFRTDDQLGHTISTLYRWIDTIISSQAMPRLEIGGYSIHRVDITPSPAYVFQYIVTSMGDALDRESQDPILVGDYGIFTNGEPLMIFEWIFFTNYCDCR